MCAIAFLVGLIVGARHQSGAERHVHRFAAAWARGDYAAMYAELSDGSRARIARRDFQRAYEAAMRTATVEAVRAGDAAHAGGGYRVPLRMRTRLFGTVAADLDLAAGDGGVDWSPELTFPGLRPGEQLRRRTTLPARAALLARDRTALAQGSGRTSPLGALASSVVGQLGPIPADRAARLAALGVPDDAEVGVSGLERIFDERLLGTPGGDLLAGVRVLAHRAPRAAPAVRTTISVPIQQAAVAALAGRLGGVVALSPRTGEVLAFAGIAFSGLQPPGSTFKLVTLTGALEAGITSPSRTYPVQTKAVLSGVELQNANGEACGGTLVLSFARSCNSVFAPLGVRLGAKRLVATAERFGFNRAPDVPGAATSSIPPAGEIADDLAVGSSAIGQGRVQATALQMATVAAAIGLRGQRPRLTLRYGDRAPAATAGRATSERVARTVERLMLAVVRGGTGFRAQIPGVEVAGKTGTAELRTTRKCQVDPGAPTVAQGQDQTSTAPQDPESCVPTDQANDPTDTDAWFAAYAPAGTGRPRVAVGVLLVASGAGGDTAAPAARGVLVAALKATGSGG
jgi:cell division protein FtsI/penicillin-binding protein 2